MTSPIVLPPRTVPIADVPDLEAHVRALGMLTDEDAVRLHAIEQAQWVLVRIDGIGERWRCNRCGCRHAHFTTLCVERPFRGLREGLRAYWHNAGVANPADLSPAMRRHKGLLDDLFDGKPPVALAERHPEMARKLATPERDLDLGVFVLGTIDPIDDKTAREKIAQINARAHRTVLRFDPVPLPPLTVFPGR